MSVWLIKSANLREADQGGALSCPQSATPGHALARKGAALSLKQFEFHLCFEFVNIFSVFCLIGAFCGMKIEIMTTLLTKNKQVPDGGRP